MPPEGIDSLDADSQKRLVLSLLERIDELFEQNKDLLKQNNSLQAKIDELLKLIGTLLRRIAELEGRAGKPPKNPTNSSLPPSSGRKANVADKSGRKKEVPQRPPRRRARALSEPRCHSQHLCRALRLRWEGTSQGSGARARLRPCRTAADQVDHDPDQLAQRRLFLLRENRHGQAPRRHATRLPIRPRHRRARHLSARLPDGQLRAPGRDARRPVRPEDFRRRDRQYAGAH